MTSPDGRPVWRWNPGLRVSPQTRGGEPVVVLQDPATGSHFQLGLQEYDIARSFDGARDRDAVLALCAARGEDLDAGDLDEFVVQLVEAGVLIAAEAPGAEAAPQAPPPRPGPRRSLPSRLLHLEIRAVQPQHFFAATLRWVRPLLGRSALGLAGVTTAVACIVVSSHFGELSEAVRQSLGARALLGYWLVFGVVVLLHELAHGYVCTLYGGRVQGLGFMLLYGRPCAYCDVSDAWLMRKAQRLWIMAAGSLLEVVLWAVATLAWRVAAPETHLHRVALLVMAVCGVGTLLNFNPLLKFDGYYMLSDGLEIPNLRQRAFAHLAARLRRRPPPPASRRERRVFVVYGTAALVYSLVVLGWLALLAQRWVQASWGSAGLLVVWGAVAVMAVRPMVRGLGAFGGALRSRAERRAAVWIGGGLALSAVLGLVPWPLKVASECRVEPRARAVVRSPIAGTVEAVLVREGQSVGRDDPVLRIATRDLDYALAAAQAEVEELEARLALLQSGARRQEIEMAERRAQAAATRVQFSALAFERASQSLASDLVSRQSVETAERELRLAEQERRAADQELELLRAGARPEEVRAMQARLEAVSSETTRLREDRGLAEVSAGLAGQVLTPRPELLVGRYVERGDSLLVLADQSAMVLEIPVPEKDVADVRIGAPVRFKSRSLPARTFAGEVVAIAPSAATGARQRTVMVRSEVDNAAGLLRADTSGFAKIYCGQRPLGAILARRGVRVLRTEFWALW
jgi:multidrug resistance efflux pump